MIIGRWRSIGPIRRSPLYVEDEDGGRWGCVSLITYMIMGVLLLPYLDVAINMVQLRANACEVSSVKSEDESIMRSVLARVRCRQTV